MPAATLIDVIGTLAGTLTTVAFVPQVVKTWRTRSTRDISLAMWLSFWVGVALWLVYGLMLDAWPVVIANLFTLVLAGIVLAVKLGNRGKE
ncbi:MAG: SemiSWEET family sugar transporter [Solirubrobacterales bacterium]